MAKAVVNLGPKGRKPVKKQRKPQIPSKMTDFRKFTTKHHKGNLEEAEANVAHYFLSENSKFKEAMLVTYICNDNLSCRLAKKIFKIGSHRYLRLKQCREKEKPGGVKPNFVSVVN